MINLHRGPEQFLPPTPPIRKSNKVEAWSTSGFTVKTPIIDSGLIVTPEEAIEGIMQRNLRQRYTEESISILKG